MPFWNGFEKKAVSKAELKEVLKKHEERETPEQEADESEEEQRIEREAGVEKKAATLGELVGEHGKGKMKQAVKGSHAAKALVGGALLAGGAYGIHRAMRKKAFDLGFEKSARKLTTKARENLADSDFVFPGERRYPIHDENHAKAALQRVSQFGTSSEKEAVRSAVKRRYPQIEQS